MTAHRIDRNAGWEMHLGDVEDVLLTLEPNSLSACLTDPPYGISFMGASWDYDVPSVHVWRALWRAMKPGAWLLSFGGTRTWHRIAVGIEDAGFEVRDTIMWMYGTGFPKSQNAAKASKRVDLEGHGTALKPAFEPVILARKPLTGTLAKNLAAHGVGTLAIDACRIEALDAPEVADIAHNAGSRFSGVMNGGKASAAEPRTRSTSRDGRWPANVILDEAAGAMIDAQSGTLVSGKKVAGSRRRHGDVYYRMVEGQACYADAGGASRFFYTAKASTSEREAGLDDLPLFAGHELVHREEGSAGTNSPRAGAGRKSAARRNTHPTVKPVALTEYLARLVLPPGGGRILVPYAGVGSEMIGAVRAGWDDVVGIERDEKYVQIARARLAHWAPRRAA